MSTEAMQIETDVTVLAQTFTERLENALTVEERADVAVRNRRAERVGGVCHSHDFLDANEYLAEAWRRALPYEMDLEVGAHTDIANAAWDEARGRWWYLWVWLPFLDALAERLTGAEVTGSEDDGDVMYGRLRYRDEDVSLWCDPDGGIRGTISVEIGHWNEQGRIVFAGDLDDANSVARAVIRSRRDLTVRRLGPAEIREQLERNEAPAEEVCLGCPTHCHAE